MIKHYRVKVSNIYSLIHNYITINYILFFFLVTLHVALTIIFNLIEFFKFINVTWDYSIITNTILKLLSLLLTKNI